MHKRICINSKPLFSYLFALFMHDTLLRRLNYSMNILSTIYTAIAGCLVKGTRITYVNGIGRQQHYLIIINLTTGFSIIGFLRVCN